jgi:hypothetical protein
MSERAPYSRVYWSVMDDPKFDDVRGDMRHFGTWTLLLIVADMAWPAPALLPRSVPKASLAVLVDTGLVDQLTGGRYRIHGLDAERGRRRDAALTGSKRPPNGTRTGGKRDPNGAQDETSIDEPSQDEPTRARPSDDLWSDPEWEALVWLQRHGCDIRPGNGYHQKLVVAVERHGVNAVVGMMDRLAEAGTRNGDVKGFLFGAIDALDSRDRPKVSDLEKEDREEERERVHQARLEKTRRETAELRAALASKDSA